MDYEPPRVTRRSVSHGALNTSYANQSRISSDSGHVLPPFRPLRSIREHQQAYLDPSASVAMEGMLRKTTETGNIGIFSIGKGNGLRPRASLGDLRQPLRSFSRSRATPPLQDDRRQLPSYRDSTSEIISMYGSENHSGKSVSGTLSPPWDDCGQRSYSMTTCGSKGYFTPRNLSHQPTSGFQPRAQRPRSPYPYPTRLARPGVRPSSPALTENGLVDYSRMVEIKRIPQVRTACLANHYDLFTNVDQQRTTHHPHKLLFPHQTTRNRLPLSMRYDINQSTVAPSDDIDSNRPCEFSSGNRPSLSSNPHLWRPGPRDRFESASSDQSPRTMSLVSMNGRYSPAPVRASHLPFTPKKPLFYDYSEDFEDAAEPPRACPIAPIPRRVSNTVSSLIAENDRGAISDAEVDGGDGEDILTCLRRATSTVNVDNENGPEREQNRPVSQLGQWSDSFELTPRITDRVSSVTILVSRQDDEVLGNHGTLPAAPMEQERDMKNCAPKTAVVTTELPRSTVSVSHSTNECVHNSMTSVVDFQSIRSEPPGLRVGHCAPANHEIDEKEHELNCSNHTVVLKGNEDVSPNTVESSPVAGVSSNRFSDYRKDSRLFSLGSGLSDLASFVKYIDQHIESSDTEDDDPDNAAAIQSSRTAAGPDFGNILNESGKTLPPPPRKSSLRPCGAYNTELKTTPGPWPDDGIDQFQVVSTRSGPTLVPQPISPAKMLRVKNSIPQLMKALPPLPGYSPAPESPFGPAVVPIDFEPFELSRLTDARSTLTEAILQGRRGHSEDGPKGHDPFVFDRRAHKPKLKLKHAASCASGHSRDLRRGYFEQSGVGFEPRPSTAEQPANAPVKRRLPIKISRTVLTSSQSEETGTVRRRPDLKKANTVSELTSKQSIDLFGDLVTPKATGASIPQQAPAIPQGLMSGIALQRAPVADIRRLFHEGDALSPFSEIRLSSLDDIHAESARHGDGGMQSFFSDNNINTPRRGLRTKISDLRIKLAEPKTQQQSRLRYGTREDRIDEPDQMPTPEVPATNTFKELLSGMTQSNIRRKNSTNYKIRSKLGRFMQGAKHKLRSWGQHRRRID